MGFALRSYWAAPFSETTHTPTFGQAPVFVPHTDPQLVVYGKDFKTGDKNQVYIQRFDGQGPATCLTCTGPGSEVGNVNGVPAVSPDGQWIIFHSWRGHYLTIGSPGYGGMGSTLWAMRTDGSRQTQLTDVQPPTAGPFNGEGVDDYHAYWSPDGTHIEYAHLNWNFVTGGGEGKWDVRVAEFHVGADGVPYLADTHIVRPANGHWYETQWWNPNPKRPGFLYTETFPQPSGEGAAMTPQLFYCQLVNHYSACKDGGTRLTNSQSWDEQAIFTPDAHSVIFMSSRAQPGIFNTWVNLAQTLGLTNDYDYLLVLPLFEAGFLQPVGQESTDLYELRMRYPEQVRRLTHDGDEGCQLPEIAHRGFPVEGPPAQIGLPADDPDVVERDEQWDPGAGRGECDDAAPGRVPDAGGLVEERLESGGQKAAGQEVERHRVTLAPPGPDPIADRAGRDDQAENRERHGRRLVGILLGQPRDRGQDGIHRLVKPFHGPVRGRIAGPRRPNGRPLRREPRCSRSPCSAAPS